MYKYSVSDITKREEVQLNIHDNAVKVQMCVGNLHILRNLEYKGKFFAPYIPTTDLLLLFPSSSDVCDRMCFAPYALDKITNYLNYVLLNLRSTTCRVIDGGLCLTSGHAFVTLRCGGVMEALQVQSVWGAVELQDETMRMSSLYIQCYPCIASESCLVNKENNSSPLSGELTSHYYHIPTCVLCADRLETLLTGEASDSPLCDCAHKGERCSCVQHSRCVVCELFLRAQETNNVITSHDVNSSPIITTNSNTTNTAVLDVGSSKSSGTSHITCQECGQAGDPWVCLICGYVGCSRYQAMHAKEHCLAHQHYFSMNLLTQQIWDYHSDAFVHRVVMHVDVAAGNAARVEYPSRDTPQLEAEYSTTDNSSLLEYTFHDHNNSTVNNNENRVLTKANDNTMPDYRPDNNLHSNSLRANAKSEIVNHANRHVNDDNDEVHCGYIASKKNVSAKYDTKLSTSHTQYAMLIKNELDALRVAFERSLEEVNKEHNTANTAIVNSKSNDCNDNAKVNNTEEYREEKEQSKMSKEELHEGIEKIKLMQSMHLLQRAIDNRNKCHDNTGDAKVCANGSLPKSQELLSQTTNVYNMFSTLSDMQFVKSKLDQEVTCLTFTLRNLNDERELSIKLNEALTKEEMELREKVRECITANTQTALTLQTSISNLETLADEIKANIHTHAQLIRQLGSDDGVDQIAVLDTGKSTKPKTQMTSRRNVKKSKSK